MAFVLALAAALLYGSADFAGGFAARRSPLLAVMIVSQAVGAVLALIAAPLVGPNGPGLADLAWGLAAGLSGCVGLGALYKGLAVGSTAVVSPLAALASAILPAAFGLSMGERPSILGLAGAGLCLPAVLLLSWEGAAARGRLPGGSRGMGEARTSLLLGLLAGLGFGGFFIALARTGPASGLWPLFAARLSSLFATAIAAALSGMFSASGRGLRKEDRPAAFGAGLFDMGANVAFLLACRSDLLIIVTVLSSLFPAPTVLLARIVYGQRVSPARLAGLVLAIAGVALIGIRG